MPVDVGVLACLIGAAFTAGWVDAVVGGGGLIQLPSLLLGLPATTSVATVSGTNKVSSIFGTATAAATYAKRVKFHRPSVIALVLSAAASSALGAYLIRFLSRESFTPIVLVVLLAVGGYTLRRPAMGLESKPALTGHMQWVATAIIGAVVGLYDGLIGPGTGTFFIISFVAVSGFAFVEASAYAKLANAATNLAAIGVLASANHVLWVIALPMAAANLTGGWIGARLALRYGNGFVRKVFLVVIGALVIKLGADTVALILP
ncbi:MAG: sulfite exporter TauE/SafE family protein [Propionibacteriaceae bacterium]